MRVRSAFFSRLGPRAINEDRLLVPSENEESFLIAAIADGIGGAPGGAQAATLAVEAAARANSDPAKMDDIFRTAAIKFRELAADEAALERMGTTLSVALLVDSKVYIAHVGDSRIYHLRGQGLVNLTEDQTEVAALLRKGLLRKSQALRYPRRNVLLSALTANADYEIYRSSAHLEIGDRLLFLTDGVHQSVPRRRILDASISSGQVKLFLENVERLATDAQPSDNFTALALQIIA